MWMIKSFINHHQSGLLSRRKSMAGSWFSLLFLLLLPLVAISLLQKHKRSKPSKRQNPPGPPKLPLIGNLHQFDGLKPHECLMKLSQKYGPLMSLKLGRIPVIVISSAEMAKEALKNNDLTFSNRPISVANQKYSRNGIDLGFAPYGEYWREMRKLTVLHLFSLKKVQSFRPIHEDEVAQVVKQISDLSSSSQIIDIGSTMVSLNSRTICRIAFGKKGDEKDKEESKEKPKRRSAHEILQEAEAFLGGFFVADYFPSLGWIDKLTGMLPRLDKNFKELDSFYQELIEEQLAKSERKESLSNDNVLQLLIQLKEDKSISTVDLTWDHIKAILTTIFLAASTSTASAITWAMTCLMKNPSTMEILKAEIRDSFRSKGKIEAEQLESLPYLNAVIKETLRLHPPAPLLVPRQTIETCTLGGYEIQPNAMVFINAWAISRDPKIWESPNEFKPERFFNNDIDLMNGQHFELIPFGSGRRGCPGAHLALAMAQLVLANLLHFFDWELPSGMKPEDIDTAGLPGISVLPKTPLYLVAKKCS
ncbi:OLC1v1015964C1 [Oldenlandia corymbosa var. corymbosa]|uniref:OLC1v1015964C1 n=1 Tax=Oldenlandia corymbosa var. corymbosa TaxID=529605 RepID=A0AAV1E759_OLDCO|nr:OLC1v1015964C1 [Oldenlandia corymbosa var. corymbosa]